MPEGSEREGKCEGLGRGERAAERCFKALHADPASVGALCQSR